MRRMKALWLLEGRWYGARCLEKLGMTDRGEEVENK
jgi:hypothetical protein